jgi:hypothetical protein
MQTGHRPGPPPPAPRGDGPAPKESLKRARARARPQGTVLARRPSVLVGASSRISAGGLGRSRAPGRRGPVLASRVNRDPEGVRQGSRRGSGRRGAFHQRPKQGGGGSREGQSAGLGLRRLLSRRRFFHRQVRPGFRQCPRGRRPYAAGGEPFEPAEWLAILQGPSPCGSPLLSGSGASPRGWLCLDLA